MWSWVHKVEYELREQGNTRLADAIDNISSYTCADEHDKVDAIFPEALSLAKKENNPWIQIFIRHWNLQSQVLHRHNVKSVVNEAIDLLEFSSREDTKDCPQSICVVQDLANTYAKKDGPSFVEERIAVSLETFKKITPAWSCYDCIGSEYISALIDSGDLEKALEEISSRREEIIKANTKDVSTPFIFDEVQILMLQGKYQQAEQAMRAAENPYAGESFVREKSSLIALTLAYQGEFERAKEYVLPIEEVMKAHSHYVYWCEYQYLASTNELVEDFQEINYHYNIIIKSLITNGVQRDTLKVLAWQIEMAIKFDNLFSAEQALITARKIISELRKDLGATELFLELEEKYLDCKESSSNNLNMTEQELIDEIDNTAAELPISRLKSASEKFPESQKIQLSLFDSLVSNAYPELAIELSNKYLKESLDNPNWLNRHGHLLIDKQNFEEFDQLFTASKFENLSEDSRLIYFWLASRRFLQDNPPQSLILVQQLLDIKPESHNALQRAACLCDKLEKYQLAQKYWDRLIEMDEENQYFHWDKLVSATLDKNWGSVRESCKALSIDLEDTQEEKGELDLDCKKVEQDMEDIRVQIPDSNGNLVNILAKRIGPVEAIISGIRSIEKEQFVGSRIVFSAYPLNQLDQEDEEGYRCDSEGYYTYLYPHFKTTKKGEQFIFDFDGIRPGKNKWDELLTQLQSLDITLSVRSSDEYTVSRINSDEELEGIYSYIACPKHIDLNHLNSLLLDWVNELEHPFIWPMLLEKIGDTKTLEKQVEIEQDYLFE